MTKSIFTNKYKIFCKMLVIARKQAGLSQTDLAIKLNRLQAYVSKYERAERRLDIIEFLEIAKILQINPSQFLEDLEKTTTEKTKNKKKQSTNKQVVELVNNIS